MECGGDSAGRTAQAIVEGNEILMFFCELEKERERPINFFLFGS